VVESLGVCALLEVLVGALKKTRFPGANEAVLWLHGMPVLLAGIILTGIAAKDFFNFPFNIEVHAGLVCWIPAQRTRAMNAPARLVRVLSVIVSLMVAILPKDTVAPRGSYHLVAASLALAVSSALISSLASAFVLPAIHAWLAFAFFRLQGVGAFCDSAGMTCLITSPEGVFRFGSKIPEMFR
jgi:hypothetical protein